METMSNSNDDHDWMIQSNYQTNFETDQTGPPAPPTTHNTTTGGATSSRSNNNFMNIIPSAAADQGGRISKPTRRRSRASRRPPATLLNTDPTNFRAMVQHFTGGTSMQQQFAARPDQQQFPSSAAINFSFAEPYNGSRNAGTASGFHVQYPNQQEHNMFMMNSMHSVGSESGVSSSYSPSRPSYSGNFGNYML